MYGKKAIYFNYKSYGGFIVFMLIPALLVLMGASVAYSFLAWQPMLIGIAAAVLLASPGYPRFIAINANADLKLNKYKKALRRMERAVKLPFAPVGVMIFHSYVLLLNGRNHESRELLNKVKDKDMSYSEKAKWDGINALLLWVESGNPENGLKYLEDKDRKGVDEAISYVKGKLLNASSNTADARKYNEKAMDMHTGNRDILSNLVVAYCRTGQIRNAKIMFRNLYHDMGTTADALYYMAVIKKEESKAKDAVDFIKTALEIESSSVDLIKNEQLVSFKEKLEAVGNEI